ncbi:2Fe-2S iron-sulfur cluster-binding protein [Brumimicrobium aurantiacum]|uniref:Flavodoxin reductase n=1 Tax=Brumimicrobium aurantiacum TaxID=1737063 RepID=A0A3E1EVV1_9FLAO|nr:2Fe-2S iron-sulfur cluster-binding protein [Brumimicrobium aurantiacum]RFC53679.1 flavodoxin reductase [Brumimicrobium aurantiacum]
MSLFKKLFGGKKDAGQSAKKGNKEQSSALLKIKQIDRLTADAVKIVFDVPQDLKSKYTYVPGQYVNVTLDIDGKSERRSYSICSDVNEPLAIGIKKVEKGIVSTFFNDQAKVDDEIEVGFPIGNFKMSEVDGEYVAFAAGSGITPVLSIAKLINNTEGGKLNLFYANRNDQSIMFEDELNLLTPDKVTTTHIFSEQEKEGFLYGMMTEEVITQIIKSDLSLLKAKGFYLCGPEQVIINAQNVLKTFGVSEDKMFYELFTTPVLMESTKEEVVSDFNGLSKVTLILDDEEEKFELESDGDTILEEAESYGIDAPYSCRGGVCCTCRAKIIKGSATMDKNFSLTDQEIKDGYVLTCQAHPNSEEVVLSYDE